MKTVFVVVTLALVSSAPLTTRAMECDNYTNRDRKVKDALAAVDTYTNLLIEAAAAKANEGKTPCDVARLYASLDDKLGATPFGVVEKFAERSKLVERLQDDPNAEASIYDGFSGWRYPLLKASGIANSVHLNGHVIGTDKFGHFMAEGLHTYRIWRETGSLEKAMRWGISTEEGYFGLTVSGIKSYGDLAANYGGAQFWASITEGRDPYFSCHEGKWVKIREFTWKEYVNDAWDEAINCSQFEKASRSVRI